VGHEARDNGHFEVRINRIEDLGNSRRRAGVSKGSFDKRNRRQNGSCVTKF